MIKEFKKYDPTQKLSGISILYHDNEESQIEEFEDTFGYLQFKKIKSTTSTDEAINLAKSGEYDVFICDLRLPRKDGITVLEESMEGNPNLAAILYTGFILNPKQIHRCREKNISRAKKLDAKNLVPIISMTANSVTKFGDSFKYSDLNASKASDQSISNISNLMKWLDEIDNEVVQERKENAEEPLEELHQRYIEIGKKLIKEYMRIPDKEKVVIHFSSTEVASIEEVVKDLKDLTPRGIEIIQSWIKANIFVKYELNKIRKHRIAKDSEEE